MCLAWMASSSSSSAYHLSIRSSINSTFIFTCMLMTDSQRHSTFITIWTKDLSNLQITSLLFFVTVEFWVSETILLTTYKALTYLFSASLMSFYSQLSHVALSQMMSDSYKSPGSPRNFLQSHIKEDPTSLNSNPQNPWLTSSNAFSLLNY